MSDFSNHEKKEKSFGPWLHSAPDCDTRVAQISTTFGFCQTAKAMAKIFNQFHMRIIVFFLVGSLLTTAIGEDNSNDIETRGQHLRAAVAKARSVSTSARIENTTPARRSSIKLKENKRQGKSKKEVFSFFHHWSSIDPFNDSFISCLTFFGVRKKVKETFNTIPIEFCKE